MDIYKKTPIADIVRDNSYVGRGIAVGTSESGKKAVCAYFIMGRSANSRNRVFTEKDGKIYTEPFDASKVEDPSLIIYTAVRMEGKSLIVTNGDQTDTIGDALLVGGNFRGALATRCFEPDSPNWTPRISAIMNFADGSFDYSLSILKSVDEKGSDCARYCFDYPAVAGLGHFIHTYVGDGSPLPTFQGEPERIVVPDDIDAFANSLWEALNEDNKISLYVRYTDLETGAFESRMFNKNR